MVKLDRARRIRTMFGAPGCLSEASLNKNPDPPSSSTARPPLETQTNTAASSASWGVLPRTLMRLLTENESGSGKSLALHVSAIEIYQGLAYDLLRDKATLTVGMKGANQRTGIDSSHQVAGQTANFKSAVGNTHPAGCRCQGCLGQKREEDELRRIKALLNRGGVEELFKTLAEKPGADPFKVKKLIAKAQTEQDNANAEKKKKKTDEDNDFTTVGEKIYELKTAKDVMTFARDIELSRTTVGHALNERSSRSHCLVNVHVTEKINSSNSSSSRKSTSSPRRSALVRKKLLLLVDLAGSERIAKSGVEGVAREQAIEINTSLTALQRVIQALNSSNKSENIYSSSKKTPRGTISNKTTNNISTNNTNVHIPYRDSMLTMLLRSSFAGRACTSVVINVADEDRHADETLRSLQFGARLAGVIVSQDNMPQIAQAVNTEALEGKLKNQLRRARAELEDMKTQGQAAGPGPICTPAQAQDFITNDEKLKNLQAKAKEIEIQKQESGKNLTKSSKNNSGIDDQLRKIKAEISMLTANIARNKTAVDRLSEMPLWKLTFRAYLSKEAEMRDIENRLGTL